MRYKLKTPKNLPPYLKKMIGREVIRTIIDRNEAGVSINGTKFVKYSDSYKNSELFQAMGKSDLVNLRLFGDMQESMAFRETRDGVEIYFRESEEAAKAHGHDRGSKILPKREWFGLNKSEEKNLIAKYEQIAQKLEDDGMLTALDLFSREGNEDRAGLDVEEFSDE